MSNVVEYENRYGDVYTFTKQEDGNVLWEGGFLLTKVEQDSINPSGGPHIKKGQMLSHVVWGDDLNVIVESFEKTENGYLIKTSPHIYDPNDFFHLQDRDIIGGII